MGKHSGGSVSASRKRGLALVLTFVGLLVVAGAGLGALVLRPTYTPSPSSASLSRGRKLLEEGRTADARALFTDQLKRNPKDIEAIRGLALCARDDGDDESAFALFQQLTTLAPKDLGAWRQQAMAAARIGRDLEAMTAAQTALALTDNKDRAMSDLLTRILTSDMDSLTNPKMPGANLPLGAGPDNHSSSVHNFDPLSEVPRPEPPDPLRGLPTPGKGK